MKKHIEWKYNEPDIIDDIYCYCGTTYEEHYAAGSIETSEFIADQGHGEGFFIGNVIKYAARYGKKDGYNKNDLYKAAHYLIMAIDNHNKRQKLEKISKKERS